LAALNEKRPARFGEVAPAIFAQQHFHNEMSRAAYKGRCPLLSGHLRPPGRAVHFCQMPA
jgi:hypothetical protein